MQGLILVILVALVFVVLYQVGRASEMIATIQGYEKFDQNRNKWMGYSMLVLMVLFFGGIWWCHEYMMPKMIWKAASDHGQEIDQMFVVTLWVCGIVFVITQILLFWFAFQYRDKPGRKPLFFAHSNKLEAIWTTIPAIAMAVLVAIGLKAWFKMTGPAPENAQKIEIIGKQFNWISRYPGPDGVFGKRYFKNINEENNILGLDWSDPYSHDDIVIPTGELRLMKDTAVELIIGSRDVIHDVGLSHFRMKMDAVPGITSRMWFTPLYTTEEMKDSTENPNFVYELSCDQMCGRGHYSMKAIVIVEEAADHKKWLSEQTAYYAGTKPKKEGEETEGAEKETEEEKTSKIKTLEAESLTKK